MPPAFRLSAAFAALRDAEDAVAMADRCLGGQARFAVRDVLGEDGRVQLVVLEATFDSPPLADRLTTIMLGCHGVPMPGETAPALAQPA